MPRRNHLCDRQCIQTTAENEGDLVSIVSQQSVLVSVHGTVECCDHETGCWRTIQTQRSPGGQLVSELTEGHTYSFRANGGATMPAVTIPYETPWQQEQFERRYHELHMIGKLSPIFLYQSHERIIYKS